MGFWPSIYMYIWTSRSLIGLALFWDHVTSGCIYEKVVICMVSEGILNLLLFGEVIMHHNLFFFYVEQGTIILSKILQMRCAVFKSVSSKACSCTLCDSQLMQVCSIWLINFNKVAAMLSAQYTCIFLSTTQQQFWEFLMWWRLDGSYF